MTDCANLQSAFPTLIFADINDCSTLSSSQGSITTDGSNILTIDITGLDVNGPFPILAPLTKLTSLSMENNGFTGNLPDLSGFSALTSVDFSHNSFSDGTIDSNSWYASNPDLISVNLQYNCLTGVSLPVTSFTTGAGIFDNNLYNGGTDNPSCSSFDLNGNQWVNVVVGNNQVSTTTTTTTLGYVVPVVPPAPAGQNPACANIVYSFQNITTDSRVVGVDCTNPVSGPVLTYTKITYLERRQINPLAWALTGLSLSLTPALTTSCGSNCPIPASLGAISTLSSLNFKGVGFTGPVPDSFANLKGLTQLNLAGNKVSAIPAVVLNSMPGLTSIDLSGNPTLTAIDPSVFANLKSLQSVSLEGTGLPASVLQQVINTVAVSCPNIAAITLPANLGLTLPPTLVTSLTTNGGAGAVAAALADTTNADCKLLQTAFQGYNTSANIPVFTLLQQDCTAVASSPYVGYVLGPSVNFTVPATVTTTTTTTIKSGNLFRRERSLARRDAKNAAYRVSSLTIANQGIQGLLPAAIGNLTYLQTLDISGNSFNGAIPWSLLQLKKLKTFIIAGNSFLGVLPPGLDDLIINKNGGSIVYGNVCIAPNPKSQQICPNAGTKIPGPVDCFALSRVTYFVQPVFDPVWQRLQDNKALADNYPKSNNPFITDYQYQAFKHYIQGVRICKKKAPYFKYWTYAHDGFFTDTDMSTDFGSEFPTDMQTDLTGATDFGTDIYTSPDPGQQTEPVWTDWWVEPSPSQTQSINVTAAPQNADCLAVTKSFAQYTTDPDLMIDCGKIANTSVWQWEYAPSAFVKRAATSSKNFKAVGLKLNDIPMKCGTKCLIPPAIGNLGSLKNLSFSGSGFTGPLPTTFAKLKNLVSLDLSGNKLTTIPNIFSGMKNLANVDLTGNSAIKTLPQSLVTAPKIASLVAEGVPVKLPPVLLKTLLTNGGAQAVAAATAPTVYNKDCLLLKTAFANYTYVTASGVKGKVKTLLNQDCFTLTNNTYVSWTIPPSQNTSSTILTASGAVASTVSASSAATSTAVASSTGKLVRRSYHLERRAPSDPQTLYRLYLLKLVNLQIAGNLPDSLGKLPYLSVVDVSGNKFSGSFPSSFLNLTRLSKLNIAGNSFLGFLPNGLTAMIANNGGSLNLGTICVAGNPAAVCPKPKQITGPVDCFALSRDATFVNPIYDPLWKRLQDFETFDLNLPKSSNPTISEYLYWQFYHYIKSVQMCQKSAPYYSYFTYAKVNKGSVPVYPSLAKGLKRRHIR
ncbi:hypothetical protein HDU99_000967 [Rhizoclosmatium hyalinum]|nr:hypothetical protein HDU99_000967 [Rhizoclosmatium hyalinum]